MEPAEAAGWKQDGAGWWWQEDNASYPVNTWKQIYGQWYYFDNNGYMLDEGWHWIDGNCYYMYALSLIHILVKQSFIPQPENHIINSFS